MGVATVEKRIEYRYTTKKGVTVLVSGVPVTTATESSGEEHDVFSMAVAMRLEELIKRVKHSDAEPGSVHRLEF
jgi:hypothetical protein